jgi:hypothetical protein
MEENKQKKLTKEIVTVQEQIKNVQVLNSKE